MASEWYDVNSGKPQRMASNRDAPWYWQLNKEKIALRNRLCSNQDKRQSICETLCTKENFVSCVLDCATDLSRWCETV